MSLSLLLGEPKCPSCGRGPLPTKAASQAVAHRPSPSGRTFYSTTVQGAFEEDVSVNGAPVTGISLTDVSGVRPCAITSETQASWATCPGGVAAAAHHPQGDSPQDPHPSLSRLSSHWPGSVRRAPSAVPLAQRSAVTRAFSLGTCAHSRGTQVGRGVLAGSSQGPSPAPARDGLSH